MEDKTAVVVTSIAPPNKPLINLARRCLEVGYHFIVIGDENSPDDFRIDGCDFYNLKRQSEIGFKFPKLCPTRHYARKNIGYLVAMAKNASVIIETDDDNITYDEFWAKRRQVRKVPVIENAGWLNVYRYFTDANIWPRGFPLEHLHNRIPPLDSLVARQLNCPIQQGLADDNPDVDAVYRLVLHLPQKFKKKPSLALGSGTLCPFNSQNTTWFSDAFALLYLPAHCSFRVTDIWRSFIAKKIASLNNWAVLFNEPTVRQERNEHNLLADFNDEIPGLLHNSEICEILRSLNLEPGIEKIPENLRTCYEKLVSMSLIGKEELKLLDAWVEDIEQIHR